MRKQFLLPPWEGRQRQIVAWAVVAAFGFHMPQSLAGPASTETDKTNPSLHALAAKLATSPIEANDEWNRGIVNSYEEVYGSIQNVPNRWQALVRRALICQQILDKACLASTLEAIDKLGGYKALPLARLFEVSRFHADLASLENRLEQAKIAITKQAVPEQVPTLLQVTGNHDAESQASVISGTSVNAEKTTPAASTPLPAAGSVQNSVYQSGGTALQPPPTTGSSWIALLAATLGGSIISLISVAIFRSHKRRKAQANQLAQEQEKARLEQKRLEEEEAARMNAIAAMQADPQFTAARRLLDALHRAERDVEPFFAMIGDTGRDEATSPSPRQILASWHESILRARNELAESLINQGWQADLPACEPATNLGEAMRRLVDHAVFFSALLLVQKKQDTAIFHWSRLLSGAVLHLFWRHQTARFVSDLERIPMAPVPDIPAPITMKDSISKPNDFYSRIVQYAARNETRKHAIG